MGIIENLSSSADINGLVTSAFKAVTNLRISCVQSLPSTGEQGIIYLSNKQTTSSGDVYTQYLWDGTQFVTIGSTSIDLSSKQDTLTAGNNVVIENNVISTTYPDTGNYYTIDNKPKINSVELVGNKSLSDIGAYTKAEVNSHLASKQDLLTEGYNQLSNKPTINSVSLSGNKTSADLSMYTKAEVDTAISSAISGVTSFNYTVVNELPTSGVKGTIYLVPNGETENKHDEYLWISEGVATPYWEKMGPKDLDISGKVDKVTTTNKLYGTDAVGGQTTYNKSDFASVSDIPTKTSDLTNDSGFIDNTYHDSSKQDKFHTISSGLKHLVVNTREGVLDNFYFMSNAPTGEGQVYMTSPNGNLTLPTIEKITNNRYATPKDYVDTALATKQNTLTAGTGIDITNNVISASENWELINSIDTSESEFVNSVTITQDSNGQPFSLRKIWINIYYFQLENVYSSQTFYFQFQFNNAVWYGNFEIPLNSDKLTLSPYSSPSAYFEKNNLFWNAVFSRSNNNNGNKITYNFNPFKDNGTIHNNGDYATFVRLSYPNTLYFKIKAKIYGVRS